MKSRFRALLLDFGAVVSKTPFEVQPLIAKGLGLPKKLLAWRGPLDPATDQLWSIMQEGKISEREYWARRAAEVGRLVNQDWDARAYYVAVCNLVGAAWFRPEIERLLDDARAANIKTGVLSNELELFHGRTWMDDVPALKKIDVLIDATHTKILKPDPRAYRLALDALHVAPQETLFVDDQRRNVEGAQMLGIEAVHFDIRRPAEMVMELRATLALPTSTA